MKKTLTSFLFSVILTTSIFADCAWSGLYVWPSSNEISVNGIIIIEGYGGSQTIIKGLNKRYKIYLKSDSSIVQLNVLKTYTSQFNLTQAILKPANLLTQGTSYSLQIDSLDEYERNTLSYGESHWTVNKPADQESPQWLRSPSYLDKVMIQYGCGPACFVNFCVCINDLSPVVVYSRMKELKTGAIYEYFVSPDSSTLEIGHGMCSGEFNFRDGEKYEISFSLMDASGNVNDTLTKAIEFYGPTEADEERNRTPEHCNCPPSPESINFTVILIIASSIFIVFLGVFFILRRKKSSH